VSIHRHPASRQTADRDCRTAEIKTWVSKGKLDQRDWVFPSRNGHGIHLTTLLFARLVGEWIAGVGLPVNEYGVHSMRKTNAALLSADGGAGVVPGSALKGDIQPVFGNALFAEYEGLLAREPIWTKCPLDECKRDTLFEALLRVSYWVRIDFLWRPDPSLNRSVRGLSKMQFWSLTPNSRGPKNQSRSLAL